ncbi:MAG: methyltransferase domain-containing protein, partial [Myxococcota bacterium]
EMLQEHPELYDQVEETVLFQDTLMPEVADGSVDVAVSFRNTHNWSGRWEGHSVDAYFQAVARVLRPGGIFGIVQHRAPEGTEHGEDGTIGYLTESFVIGRAEAAGLELAERSEMHANPRDTHDHPEGVWSLPPVMRGDSDPEAMRAIGESDRMTLTFRKPDATAVEDGTAAPDNTAAEATAAEATSEEAAP